MNGPELYFVVMGIGLGVWALTAGADFGAGLWDLLAGGPRKAAQRATIERAIAPIWEANHVWLIFVIVLMFTVFPRGFSAIGVALHVPLTLALVGIVLRGAAFTFRAYGVRGDAGRGWGRTFAASSLFTPVVLGMSLGALATGDIRLEAGRVVTGFFAGWLTPFAVLVGLLSLGLFAMLAAVYLAAEAKADVQDDFRKRAIIAELIAGGLAAATFLAARSDAPELFARLAGAPWTLAIQAATAGCAVATIALLWTRRYAVARYCAAAQVSLVVLGFGLAMDGHILMPDLHVTDAGARAEVLAVLPLALLAGAAVLVPSLYFLFKVFKTRPEGV